MPLNETLGIPEFQPLTPSGTRKTAPRWERIHDLPMDLTIELGTSRIPLSDLAHLDAGHTIVLDQLVGEPVNCRLNGVLVARGEIGVQGDQYTVQIQEVLTNAPTGEASGWGDRTASEDPLHPSAESEGSP